VSRESLINLIEDALRQVAPEVEPGSLDPNQNLRDQIEIDSIDFVRFVMAVSQRTGVEVSPLDYPRLSSLASCAEYFAGRTGE
jgi:acyl carrier protein